MFTAPADFTAVSVDHTFTPTGGSSRCTNIAVVADGSVEGVEFFFVQLMSAANSEILGDVTSATVFTMDMDSELIFSLWTCDFPCAASSLLFSFFLYLPPH